MTNNKLDFEAARKWAEQAEPDTSYISGGMKNLAACYLALLQKTEKLKAELEKISRNEYHCYCDECDADQLAIEALKEFEGD